MGVDVEVPAGQVGTDAMDRVAVGARAEVGSAQVKERGVLVPIGVLETQPVVSPVSKHRLRTELPAAESAAVMMIVSDPESLLVPTQDLLRIMFHLTPAESQLAQRLARGASLPEAAGYLRLSVETVRKRLKAIFQKTGTSRQPELMSLLVSIGCLDGRLPGNGDIP